MSQYDENAAIGMDDGFTVEYDDAQKLIPDGEYLFRIINMKREQVEKTDKMPAHINIKFQIKIEDADGVVGTAWDNVRMYMKWAWKFAELAKAIGDTPPDSKTCRINWGAFVGAEGRVKVGNKTWEKRDGTKEPQNTFKYLPPAVSDGEQPF